MLQKVRHLMEDEPHLAKLVPVIQRTWVMQFRRELRNIKGCRKEKEKFRLCYEGHRDEFEKVARMLEDDYSRKTLRTVIDFRLDPRVGVLRRGGNSRSSILFA